MSRNKKQHVCSECGRVYEYYYNLRKHVMKAHPAKIDKVAPPLKGPKFKTHHCHVCDKRFTLKQNLKSHLIKFHNVDKIEENSKISDGMKNVSITSEDRHFPSFASFLEWKNRIENETKFCYVKKRGFYLTANKKKMYYYVCHRSGFFVSESKGIRRMRKGSVKIDGVCPACMKITEHEDGTCKVIYIATHICHQKELSNLDLTDLERKVIGTDITRNVPFKIMLDKIRNSLIGLQHEQIHLITKKELYNVERNYKLSLKSIKHPEECPDIEAWVNEMNESDPLCVLFYKPQGTVSEKHPNLSSNDFLLIIMNNAQCEILKKYGSDCICMDRIQWLDGCGFQLITILVVDSLKKGFPCTFLISNRSDKEILSLFFNSIKAEVGYISPKIFMSDLVVEFYNVWSEVMGPVTVWLYSSWCVDESWRKNIQYNINKVETQIRVYKMVRALMQETDKEVFERLFPLVISILRDDLETLEFAEYFQQNYSKSMRLWAYCYRIDSGLNTNIHIERMCASIKYICLFQRNLKRLDNVVYMLMHFVRDQFCNRLIVLSKEKQASILKEIRRTHVMSLEINKDMIIREENGWKIESLSSNITDVCLVQKNISDCNCNLICSDCSSCIHMYKCSCLDSSVKWNMCKHIHSICNLNQVSQESNAGLLTIEIDEDLIDHDEAEILTQICSVKVSEELLQTEKEKIKCRLINLIDELSTSAEIDVLKNHVASLEATINIVRSQAKPRLFHTAAGIHLKDNAVLPELHYNSKKKLTTTDQEKI